MIYYSLKIAQLALNNNHSLILSHVIGTIFIFMLI